MKGEEHCGYGCVYEKRDFHKMLARLWDFAQYDQETALEIAEEFASKSEQLRRFIEDLPYSR